MNPQIFESDPVKLKAFYNMMGENYQLTPKPGNVAQSHVSLKVIDHPHLKENSRQPETMQAHSLRQPRKKTGSLKRGK